MTLLRLIALSTLSIAILPLATSAAPAQEIQISKDNKTISITASAEASTLADTAVVTIGFKDYGKDQDSTYAEASKTSNAIISALTSSGLQKDAIQSQQQNLSELIPANLQDKPHYDDGMRYQFSQHWQVTVPADQAANLLHLAITSGANDSGNINWQLKNDDTLQAEAAAKALHHAREIAEHMAEGLNAKLGNLLYASNQTPVVTNYGYGRSIGMGIGDGSGGGIFAARNLKPLAISPDRITRSATVYAVFSIE
jgi:uncharacterized protein YggE